MDHDLLAFASGENSTKDSTETISVSFKKSASNEKKANIETSTDAVSIADLTSVLVQQQDGTSSRKLDRLVSSIQYKEHKALNPTDQKKLQRQAAYEINRKQAQRWIPIIKNNRNRTHQEFGPDRNPVKVLNTEYLLHSDDQEETSSMPKKQKFKEIAGKLMDSITSLVPNDQQMLQNEGLEMAELDPEQVEKRYAELAKKRALMLYQERKNKQQAKIKSKSFRKHVRKEKEKKLEKESRDQEPISKEQVADEHVKADMARARERMELKTRKANQWAQKQMNRRDRLDKGSRDAIMEQVREKQKVREEIFGKASALNHSDEDLSEDEDLSSECELSGIEDFAASADEEVEELFASSDEDSDQEQVIGRRVFSPSSTSTAATSSSASAKTTVDPDILAKPELDQDVPIKIHPTTSKSSSAEQPSLQGSLNSTTDQAAQSLLIKEAFEMDNVFAEFQAEKDRLVEEEGPKQIDLTLPGWGSWGGPDTNPSMSKTRVYKNIPGVHRRDRRDAHLKHVIIHEGRSKRSAKMMASQLPYPHKDLSEFEEKLEEAVGPEWNTVGSYIKKIKPRVKVAPGCIIPPARLD